MENTLQAISLTVITLPPKKILVSVEGFSDALERLENQS